MTLALRYREVLDQPSDIQGHLRQLVRLVQKLEAKTVIELGVRFGTSTIAWLYALSQTGGHLWSVDTEERHPPWLNGEPQWTFVRGHDLDLAVVDQLPAQADIVFVDSDHRYDLTRSEIELYKTHVRPGGVMVFHDTNVERFDHHPPGEPPYPVRTAVEELLSDHPQKIWSHSFGLTEVWL